MTELQNDLTRAAEILEDDAQMFFEAYTINGKWPKNPDPQTAQAMVQYRELKELADRLRGMVT